MSRNNQRKWDLTELLSVVGFVFELIRVVVNALRKRGGTIEHLRRLLNDRALVDKVFDLIVNKDDSVSPSLRLVLDLIETGKASYQDGLRSCRLRIMEGGVQQTLFQASDLQVVNFEQQGDGVYISGRELRTRALVLEANLGIFDLKFLLENEAEIPVELQKRYLIFTGTVLQSAGDKTYIAYLVFNDGQWQLEFEELPGGFYSRRDSLIRSAATPG